MEESSSNKPLKSILKKPKESPDSDEEFAASSDSTSSDDEIEKDSADELPKEFIYSENGFPYADYRRMFSVVDEQRAKWKVKRYQLGSMYPPKHIDANSAKTRFQNGENLFKKLADISWKDCASFERNYKYAVMRKRVNVDLIRQKYKRKLAPPEGSTSNTASSSTKKRRRPGPACSNQEECSSSRLSTSLLAKKMPPSEDFSNSTPSSSKNILHKTNKAAFISRNDHKKARIGSSQGTDLDHNESEKRQESPSKATKEVGRKVAGK
jgi:hypothetical protein